MKLRSEFLNEREAGTAMEKISPHCHTIKIINNGNVMENNDAYFESFEPNFYDYSMMSGINTGWSLNPFGAYNFEHTRSYNYLSSLGLGRNSGKAVIEADVPHEKYEFVKERLYSLGALSVT